MPEVTQTLIAFSCPSCGAEIDVVEGYTNTRCKFCDGRFLITKTLGAPRVFTKPKIDNPKKVLTGIFGRDAEIVDLDLLFIPFIKASAEVIGWLKGYKKGEVVQEPNYTDSGMNVDTISAPRVIGEERIKKRIRRILEVKLDPSEFYRYGIKRVSTEGKKFEVYDDEIIHRYGDIFDLPLSVTEYLEKASRMLIDEIIRYYSDFDEFEHYLKVIKKKAIIYYNPIFFSRIKSGGENYTYSFDAVDGKPLLRDKEKRKKDGAKIFLGMDALYGVIGLCGIICSFATSFLGKGVGFIAALFSAFTVWILQYGNK
jgi:DNA-directed RNA polymerase subunit RPC12/RpoP